MRSKVTANVMDQIMPKHNPLFAVSTSFEFRREIPEGFWERVESAYGNKLDGETRHRLTLAFWIYRHFASSQNQMAKPEEVSSALKKFREAADQLAALLPQQVTRSIRALSIRVFDGAEISEPEFFSLSDDKQLVYAIPVLATLLEDVRKVLNPAVNAASVEALHVDPLKLWQGWVLTVKATLKDRGLPTTVSNGFDRQSTAKASPFILLIAALQEELPAGLRRHDHSIEALSKAVSRLKAAPGDFYDTLREWFKAADLLARTLPFVQGQ